MFDYHVITFDHERAAQSLVKDLATLQVPGFMSYPQANGHAVAILIPDGTPASGHLAAVKAIALGRGSHSVRHARF